MFKDFLARKLYEKNWSYNRLYEISGVRNGTLGAIKQGRTKRPDPETLQKIAKAFNEEVDIWMEAAGYFEGFEESKEITEAIKKKFGILFRDEEVATILIKPGIVEIIEALSMLPEEKQALAIETIKNILRGFK